MTTGEFLADSTARLRAVDIDSARLDCLILLEDALGTDRASLLAHPERKILSFKVLGLHKKVAQRATHTPLAYIRGKVEFYGREFLVNKHVLVPRPESEAMIELLLGLYPADRAVTIADIGTGSGCLGITAALELPNARVTLYDIDPAALKVAQRNAKQLGAKVHTQKSDLLQAAKPGTAIILANLPYVPASYPVNEAARHEPPLALFAGKDGLDLYRRFWQETAALSAKPEHILTESLPSQHNALTALATAAGYRQVRVENLVQLFSKT